MAVRNLKAAPSPRGCALLSCTPPKAAAASQIGAELIVFGGSSEWSDLGATAFHADTNTLQLDGALDALDAALAGKVAAGATPPVGEAESHEAAGAAEPAAKRLKADEVV